jgi:nicotinamidase-related amidase
VNAHVDLRSYTDSTGVPTLVLVDVQREYLASPRRLALPHISEALSKCKHALTHARTLGFPVAYVRWLGRSTFFNPESPFSDWIEGFEPHGTDMIFERSKPSCYASASFAKMIDQGGGHFIMAGFAGEAACLSTAVDAFHRGHRVTYLHDASTSHPLHEVTAAETHRFVSQVISLYAHVIETAEWASISSQQPENSSWR